MLGYSTRDGVASSNPLDISFCFDKSDVSRYEKARVVIPRADAWTC